MGCTRGFTLLELMVATAVLAVLLTLGIPSFAATARQNCVATGANSLLAELLLARSEAVKRSTSVSICRSLDGETCSRKATTLWSDGLVVFEDGDRSGTLDAGERVINAISPMSTCGVISSNKFSNYISFDAEGRANSNGSFFVAANGAAAVNRTLSVFVSRVRICNRQTDKSCPAAPS